jgi:hypothetical protein
MYTYQEECFVPLKVEFIICGEKRKAQFSKWKKLQHIVEMYERDTNPQAIKFCQQLLCSYTRLTSNKSIKINASNGNLDRIFGFGFMGNYVHIGNDDFLESVYTYSHDKSFQEDLIDSFNRLYQETIDQPIDIYLNSANRFLNRKQVDSESDQEQIQSVMISLPTIKHLRIKPIIKLKLKSVYSVKQWIRFFKNEQVAAVIVLCNLVSIATTITVSVLEFGVLGFIGCLLIFSLIAYWAMLQFDRYM